MSAQITIYIDDKELTAHVKMDHCSGDYFTPPMTTLEIETIEHEGRDVTKICERWSRMTDNDLDDMVEDGYNMQYL
tara:strand:- start:3198 stop:3425 length:228 start_codon:yes stop_codon:yes gene_type:complete